MPPRKIANRWHVDFRLNGKRYRTVAPENSKSNALRYEETLRKEIIEEQTKASQVLTGPTYDTYEAFANDWLETYVKANNRPSEQLKKKGMLRNHLIPRFGQFRLEQITEREIELMKCEKIADGLSPKTIKNMLSIFRKSLDTAVEWGCLSHVPRFTWIRVPKTEITVLSKQTEYTLLNDRTEPMWNTMIVLALKTGMRLGEMLALRWQDINYIENMINVNGSMNIEHHRAPTKNGKCRTIPMGKELQSLLQQLFLSQETKPCRESYLFAREDGLPYTIYAAGRKLRKIVKRLKITEHVHWHKLRHTFATNIAKRGVNMRILQELLGHSTIIMTERYSHVDMEAKQHAIQLLEISNENFGQILGRFAQFQTLPKTQQSQAWLC